MEDGGKGPVEPGAHFYRSMQLDGDGNPINKRNAWQTAQPAVCAPDSAGRGRRGALPGEDSQGCQGADHLTARLNYRKFSWYYTQFAYAGVPKPGQDPALLTQDSTAWNTASIPRTYRPMSRARSRAAFPICRSSHSAEAHCHAAAGRSRTGRRWCAKQDRERWNDWGIGLLLQGDLKGAEYAFQRVTEAEPAYADGWLNVARALIQEGETDARQAISGEGPRAQSAAAAALCSFRPMSQKADGDYDGALTSLWQAAAGNIRATAWC